MTAGEQAELLRRAVEEERWGDALVALEAQAAALEADSDALAGWGQVRLLWEWARRQAVAARAAAARERQRLALARRYARCVEPGGAGSEWRG